MPAWWPASLRGVLSIIEHEGAGEYRTAAVPPDLEPYGANMVVHVLSLLAAGGFGGTVGRYGQSLLSDEEVQVAWMLQDAGYSVRYNSRITVYHQIQARRMEPAWLLSRLYWQGASTVLTRRLLQQPAAVWRELPHRLAVACLLAPTALIPRQSTVLLWARWRLAYATGFIRAACGWHATEAAIEQAAAPATALSCIDGGEFWNEFGNELNTAHKPGAAEPHPLTRGHLPVPHRIAASHGCRTPSTHVPSIRCADPGFRHTRPQNACKSKPIPPTSAADRLTAREFRQCI